MRSGLLHLIPSLLSALSLGMAVRSPAADARLDFNFHIRPLLSDRCFKCHGPDERGRKAKLRLDTQEGWLAKAASGLKVVVPGNRSESELWSRITTRDPDDLMPPTDSHLSLSPAEIELLGRWIDSGAVFKRHWAFNPLEAVEVPAPADAAGMTHPIDAFIARDLQGRGLQPAPEATREQWFRRIAFDLTGLPPTLDQLDAFLADTQPDAYARAVDAFLGSPGYGERMASEWLDLARYADTYGYQSDAETDMSPWRDWVIAAFNRNLPWDQFILWQLAGDLLPDPTREQYLATAFNRLHRQTNEGGSIEEEFRVEYVADRVHTAGTAFLGLTMECSRCHDHKYDPISQRDYYRMFAFFNNIDESGLYSHFTHAIPTPTLLLYGDGQETAHRGLRDRIADSERNLDRLRVAARARFDVWWRNGGVTNPPALPGPIAAFNFDQIVTNRFLNQIDATKAASLADNPELVDGRTGKAVRFSGDNSVTVKGVGHFKRTDPFSLSLWIHPSELLPRAVLIHRSRAWTDSGSRGYELVLENGRPSFGLIHFWPGNAVAVRSRTPVPTNAWSHLVVTHDGSSRASGLRVFLNGQSLDTEVIRDNLYRDIVHRAEWGDADVGGVELTLAGRFRDSGFRNGAIDDLKVFDVSLTADEVRRLHSVDSGTAASTDPVGGFETYAQRVDDECRRATRALRALREEENSLVGSIREIMVMRELDERRQAFVLKRGSYDAPSEPVDPGVPEKIMALPKDSPPNRLGLARWIIDPANPLTARVAVNRIWKLHFGRGLVPTVEDFGAQGQMPSHPDLLDWLALRFIQSGWDRKAMHRLMVTSAAYRRSSQGSLDSLAADPENRWYSRGPRHRLQAEQIRDHALAASGLLVTTVGGRSVRPYQPPGVWEESGTGKTYTQDKGEKLYRRSLYTFWRRTAPPPSMLSFDATSREVCTAKREITATPLQALVLLNDVQFIEAARVLAEALILRHPQDVPTRMREAFRRLTSRVPDAREAAILERLFAEQLGHYRAQPAAAEKLLAQGERTRNKDLETGELAATTLVVSALMNHDEFVTKR